MPRELRGVPCRAAPNGSDHRQPPVPSLTGRGGLFVGEGGGETEGEPPGATPASRTLGDDATPTRPATPPTPPPPRFCSCRASLRLRACVRRWHLSPYGKP